MQSSPAEIVVSPSSLAFGEVIVGATSDEQTITIENTGDETLNVTVSITGSHSSQFALTSGGGSYSIPGGTTSDVSVVFSPSSRGSKNAEVTIQHDATNVSSPQTVDLTGTGAPAILYVNELATGTETGLNWTDAYTDLQDALTAAAEGASIWVAEGTYKPTSTLDRSINFEIKKDIKLYGGFSGSETTLDQRDWAANPTILSGDIGVADAPDDNSQSVVMLQDVSSSARIDGFTISDGYATNGDLTDLELFTDIGGGILCEGSVGKICDPILANLTIKDNWAEFGGGVYNNGTDGQSKPTLINVVFLNNSTFAGGSAGGGGMYNNGRNSGDSSPILKNVTFYGNSANNNGGAITNNGVDSGNSTPTLTNVILWGNTADAGSQIANFDAAPVLTNCLIEGGLDEGIFNDSGSTTVDGGGNISSNPLLVSAADLRLQPFSPAIDAGTADTSGLSLPAVDLDGTVRVKGTVDIGAYESGLHLEIPGSKGWRMMTSPLAAQSYATLLDSIWTQGITGADYASGTANIYFWEEATSSFQVPADMSDAPASGTGFAAYVFGDDDFDGTPDGFPKQLSATGSEPDGPVGIGVSATDENSSTDIDAEEGWNLLGNPFATPILVDEILSAAAAVDGSVNTNVYVWDHGSGSYSVFPQGGGHTIAPWQSYWIRYTAAGVSGTLTLDRATAKTESAAFQKAKAPLAGLTLTLSGPGPLGSSFKVILDPNSQIGTDRWDAYRPAPLSAEHVSLYSIEDNTALAHSHLPVQLNEPVELPLAVEAAVDSDQPTLTLSWIPQSLPAGWNIELRDTRTGRVIGLGREGTYIFKVSPADGKAKSSAGNADNGSLPLPGPALQSEDASTSTRFTLTINPNGPTQQLTGLPEQVALAQNYPNPFNPETVIRYGVPEGVRSRVELEVFDLLGRRVATLVDGPKAPGRYEVPFDASRLSSGMYVYRLRVGPNVLTRKMILIK